MDNTVIGRVKQENLEARRRAVLNEALRELVEHGIKGLSLRRLAKRVGASTTIVYTLFGGKPELLRALYREGFALFAAAFQAVPQGSDPMIHFVALADAYRNCARLNPRIYGLIYGAANPEYTPPSMVGVRERTGYRVLVERVNWAIDEGALLRRDPELIAEALWTTMHGFVSLEFAGFYDTCTDATHRYRQLVQDTLRSFAPPHSRLGNFDPGA